MPTATTVSIHRASTALLLSLLLLAAGCGSDSESTDTGGSSDSYDYPSANGDAAQSSVGGSAVTVDGMTVEVSSASVSEVDGEPAVALAFKATNDGDAGQLSPQAFVVCDNGTVAIERGGDYRAAIQLAPGEAEEGELLLSFGSTEGQTCSSPMEIDVRFGGSLGGLVTLTNEELSAATFSIDEALAADITSNIFGG